MKSLLNPGDNQNAIKRVNAINKDTMPLWGKMNAAQMMAHISEAFKLTLGDMVCKRVFLGYIFGKIAKRKILSKEPFAKNLPTVPGFIINDNRDLELERERLIQLLKRYKVVFNEGINPGPHPFFGQLTPTEWDLLTTKHLDHHLKQFGV
jgi:hypothetical protein